MNSPSLIVKISAKEAAKKSKSNLAAIINAAQSIINHITDGVCLVADSGATRFKVNFGNCLPSGFPGDSRDHAVSIAMRKLRDAGYEVECASPTVKVVYFISWSGSMESADE